MSGCSAVAWGPETGAAEDGGAHGELGGDVWAEFCDEAAAVGAEGEWPADDEEAGRGGEDVDWIHG